MTIRTIKTSLLSASMIALAGVSCATTQSDPFEPHEQAQAEQQLINTVAKSSRAWKEAFNSGDASAATAMYEKNALMVAKPFGSFNGHEEIKAFWTGLIEKGFDDVVYENSTFTVIDEKTVRVSADWTMNNAGGVITNELWVVQPNGVALLREDHFEVTK